MLVCAKQTIAVSVVGFGGWLFCVCAAIIVDAISGKKAKFNLVIFGGTCAAGILFKRNPNCKLPFVWPMPQPASSQLTVVPFLGICNTDGKFDKSIFPHWCNADRVCATAKIAVQPDAYRK